MSNQFSEEDFHPAFVRAGVIYNVVGGRPSVSSTVSILATGKLFST